jgi:hypothetical protein
MDHECISDNKMIAEFMGVDYVDIDTYLENNKELQYHTSWDWLMPVVQKCRLDGQNLVGIDNWSEIGSALEECNIDNTYQAVVEFIKEHNKYICGSCGDHVNEVVFNEDTDVDECTNCTEYYER